MFLSSLLLSSAQACPSVSRGKFAKPNAEQVERGWLALLVYGVLVPTACAASAVICVNNVTANCSIPEW